MSPQPGKPIDDIEITLERTHPKRFRAGDVIENLQRTIEALTTRTAEPYCSVEFTRNAKGDTQISVKTSAPGGTTDEQLEELSGLVYAHAVQTYNAATAKFPAASGFVTNDGKGEAK